MTGSRDDRLDLEKLKIAERLVDLEKTVGRAFNKLYGDPEANPPVLSLEARLEKLEKVEHDRENGKKELIKTALGSVTISVGAMVLWILAALREAFIHHKP